LTFRFQRMLAPLLVTAACAVAAPAALAADTVTFPEGMPPETTVTLTDDGMSASTVKLTVTVADSGDLAKTKVFFGGDGEAPYFVVGLDGVSDSRYDDTVDEELTTPDCAVYGSSMRYDDVHITPVGADSFTAELPKGELIAFQDTRVAVGVVGQDTHCDSFGVDGLDIDYLNNHQRVGDFTWSSPTAPVVTATGGRGQIALSFDHERGTHYTIYKVVGGTPESTPLVDWINGDDDDVQYVVTEDTDRNPLVAGTEFTFVVRATRDFHMDTDGEESSLFSGLSAPATATTTPYQTVQFTGGPAASTTARSAQLSWSMTGNDAGVAPWCGLDQTETSGTEVPCTATGASIDTLAVGAHTLTVYPDYSNGTGYTYSWTVTEVPTTPPPVVTPPTAPTAPKNAADLDGDGITNTWLVGGKAAAAPGTPKANVSGGKVKLKLTAAPKGAKSIRVYRADGKGGYKLVKTLKPKSKSFTDAKVKPGHSYKYKTVAVNAKGEQGKASGTATAKVKKKP
jgi:hypothetical protein